MSTHDPRIQLPKHIQYNRFARNGTLVQGMFYKQCAETINHISAYRRKCIATFQQNLVSMAAGDASTPLNSWRTYFHAGHGVSHVVCWALLARPDNGTDPYCDFTIAPAGGAVSDTSHAMPFSCIDATPADTPNELVQVFGVVDATADAAQEIQVRCYDYSRIAAISFWEVGEKPVDTANTGTVDPRVGGGVPIYDSLTDGLLVGTGELLRSNRPHLVTWAAQDGVGSVTAATTYTNVLDLTSTTAGASSTPGFMLETQYHNTYSRTAVPVILAVYAYRSSGANSGSVKIDDGSNSVEITGIDDTEQWWTQSGTIPAAAATKYDVMAKAGASSEITVSAFAFYEYE